MSIFRKILGDTAAPQKPGEAVQTAEINTDGRYSCVLVQVSKSLD